MEIAGIIVVNPTHYRGLDKKCADASLISDGFGRLMSVADAQRVPIFVDGEDAPELTNGAPRVGSIDALFQRPGIVLVAGSELYGWNTVGCATHTASYANSQVSKRAVEAYLASKYTHPIALDALATISPYPRCAIYRIIGLRDADVMVFEVKQHPLHFS